MRYVFFGGEPLAVPVLDRLLSAGFKPDLIVTGPDRRSGRGLALVSPPTKIWGQKHDVAVLQPESLNDRSGLDALFRDDWDVFVVAAYPKIIPADILNLPKHGSINLHPSLLPLLRGPSPIRSAILEDLRETGVSIMKMDEEMDHGPVLTSRRLDDREMNWPPSGPDLDRALTQLGADLLVETLPRYVAGEIVPESQDHSRATYTRKFDKEDALLDLNGDPYRNLLKIKAFAGAPGAYFFQDGKRVKVIDASLDKNGQLSIERVVPEGKKEMSYRDFLSGTDESPR